MKYTLKLFASLLLSFGFLLTCNSLFAAQTIPLYTYYTDPPYTVTIKNSATKWLASYLTEKSARKYVFIASHLPRKRLDYMIKKPGWKGVVAWSNPAWFDDPDRKRYLWSHAFMRDADLVVSRKSRPVIFENSDSLNGLVLGGIYGHRYPDFDKQLKQGKIQRENARTYLQNLKKLHAGRVDVIFLQASALPYFKNIYPGLGSWLFVAPRPRGINHRYIFTGRENKPLMLFINRALKGIQSETEFRHFFDNKYITPSLSPVVGK